jgi:DNA-binding PadR family transcriptional regulator
MASAKAAQTGEDLVREFVRGAMQVHVLHHAAEGKVHGAWLSVELARHGYQVSPGTLYPLLHRMERKGLVVSHKEVEGGRVRRVYKATPAGRRALRRLRVAAAELAEEVAPRSHGRQGTGAVTAW